MDRDLAKALTKINDGMLKLHKDVEGVKEKEKSGRWIEYAMRFGTTLSAAGAIGFFSLFTITLPNMREENRDVARELVYVRETLAEVKQFTKDPRFTEEKYNLIEQKKDAERAELKAQLQVRSGWMGEKDTKDNNQDVEIRVMRGDIEKIKKKIGLSE